MGLLEASPSGKPKPDKSPQPGSRRSPNRPHRLPRLDSEEAESGGAAPAALNAWLAALAWRRLGTLFQQTPCRATVPEALTTHLVSTSSVCVFFIGALGWLTGTLAQRAPAYVAPGTGFTEDGFSTAPRNIRPPGIPVSASHSPPAGRAGSYNRQLPGTVCGWGLGPLPWEISKSAIFLGHISFL